jgi:hypothetical protein
MEKRVVAKNVCVMVVRYATRAIRRMCVTPHVETHGRVSLHRNHRNHRKHFNATE